jgi:hypothetical protein
VPIFGGFSAFTTRFLDGVTFDTLPNLCKRNSPLEKHVRDRDCGFKAFWMVYKHKVADDSFAVESFLNKKCG